MREFSHLIVVFFLFALVAAPCLAVDDGITLTVDRGMAPDECVLEWSGGSGPYRVYRSDDATSVTVTGNLLGETSMISWTEPAPPGDLAFYRVTSVPDVFRITDIGLMDPHVFAQVLILCVDVTNGTINATLQERISGDSDLDGLLDFSPLILFRPLNQVSAGGNEEFGIGDCTDSPDTVCDQNPMSPPVATSFSNVTIGSCMAPYPGTTSGYLPAIVPTDAPPTCFVSDGVTIVLDLGSVGIPLQDVQLSANYVGDPADSLINGLMRGFIAESVADTLLVDLGSGVVPLSSLLPGGEGNCASGDDKDTGLDGSTIGWWLYFNFTASEVTYIGP